MIEDSAIPVKTKPSPLTAEEKDAAHRLVSDERYDGAWAWETTRRVLAKALATIDDLEARLDSLTRQNEALYKHSVWKATDTCLNCKTRFLSLFILNGFCMECLEARNAELLAACKAVVKENLMLGGHFLRREALYDLPVVIAWAEGKAVPNEKA